MQDSSFLASALKENLSTKTVVYGLFVIPPSSTPEFGPGSELRTF